MKILHINSYFFTNKIHENLVSKLDRKKYKNICLVAMEKNTLKNSFKIGNNSNIEVNKIFNKYDKFLIFSKMLKIKKMVEERIVYENINKIYAHTVFTNGYAAFKMKKKFEIDYIVAVRNTDINVFFKKIIFLRKLGIDILKNAEQIVFISESLKHKFFEKYVSKKDYELLKRKSIVIPNGLDDYWLENQKIKKEYFDSNKINLLFVGSLDDNKDAFGLANALKDFNLDKEIILRIVGDGKNRKKIEELAKKYPQRIVYLGKITEKEELKKIFDRTDIFIMISKYETLGMVYLEALSQGIPVIYTKGEAIDGMISEKISFRIEYKNYKKLKEVIKIQYKNLNEIKVNNLFNIHSFNFKEILKKYKF